MFKVLVASIIVSLVATTAWTAASINSTDKTAQATKAIELVSVEPTDYNVTKACEAVLREARSHTKLTQNHRAFLAECIQSGEVSL